MKVREQSGGYYSHISLIEFLDKLDVHVREGEKSRMIPQFLPQELEGCNFHPLRWLSHHSPI